MLLGFFSEKKNKPPHNPPPTLVEVTTNGSLLSGYAKYPEKKVDFQKGGG